MAILPPTLSPRHGEGSGIHGISHGFHKVGSRTHDAVALLNGGGAAHLRRTGSTQGISKGSQSWQPAPSPAFHGCGSFRTPSLRRGYKRSHWPAGRKPPDPPAIPEWSPHLPVLTRTLPTRAGYLYTGVSWAFSRTILPSAGGSSNIRGGLEFA